MLKKNIIANFANQLLGVGFPVITQIYIIRHLALIDIGLWNTLLSVQSIVILSFSFINLYALKKISSTNDVSQQSMYVTNFSVLIYIIMIIPVVLSLAYLFNEYQSDWQIILICFLPLLTIPLSAEYYFQATLKNDIIFYRRLFSRTFFLILLLILVKDPSDFKKYACIVSMTLMIEHLINFIFIKKLFNVKKISFSTQKNTVISSIAYLPFNLSYNTLPQISVIIGARFLGPEKLAAFSILVKLVNLATTFISSSVMVIYPYRLNRSASQSKSCKNEHDDFWKFFYATIVVSICIVFVLIIFKPLIYFLFLDNKSEFFSYAEYSILTCYVIVHSMYNYIVFNHFFERNQLKKVIIMNLSIITIFISFVFGSFFLGVSIFISGIFLASALIPSMVLLLINYKERKKMITKVIF
jgi:O-antigen/teichoic acid export membrane protein